jgi:hypothetical protein
MIRFNEKLTAQASPLLLKCCKGLEGLCARVDEYHQSTQVALDPVSLINALHNEYIRTVLRVLYATYLTKFRELLHEMIHSANEERFIVFALTGRTFIETTAVLRFYNSKILKVVRGTGTRDHFSPEEFQAIASLLDQHSRGGRFDWFEFWTSNREDMAAELVSRRKSKGKEDLTLPNPIQVNAMTALDSWAKEEPAIILGYEFFCELVHPNLGSMNHPGFRGDLFA